LHGSCGRRRRAPVIADTPGWIYYKKGLLDTAFPLVPETARNLQKNAAVRYHRGTVLSMRGRRKDTWAESGAVLALDAGFPGAKEAKKEPLALK
jgi:hypothetical protein